jgi:hypothetical protein
MFFIALSVNGGSLVGAVSVYAFVIWDRERGGNVRPPRLATLEAIERVHGVAVVGTGRSVDESELDGNQFYPRKSNIQLDSQDLLKLRVFQSAFEHNVGNPLPREDIERFIDARGLAVRLTSKGEAVLKR